MTDEGYRCGGCGREDCDSHIEFKYGESWFTEEEVEKLEPEGQPTDERRICGETGEPAESYLIWSTEDRR